MNIVSTVITVHSFAYVWSKYFPIALGLITVVKDNLVGVFVLCRRSIITPGFRVCLHGVDQLVADKTKQRLTKFSIVLSLKLVVFHKNDGVRSEIIDFWSFLLRLKREYGRKAYPVAA